MVIALGKEKFAAYLYSHSQSPLPCSRRFFPSVLRVRFFKPTFFTKGDFIKQYFLEEIVIFRQANFNSCPFYSFSNCDMLE